MPTPRITVVIPTLDEARALPGLLAALGEVEEIVVVDGGSTDATCAIARATGARVLSTSPGRGPQQNAGAAVATGDRLWFLHADTAVPAGAVAALRAARGPWGCFGVTIPGADPRLDMTAAFMTRRARTSGSCTGDMGIWAEPAFFAALGGFPPIPAFEDLVFSDRARARMRPEVLEPALGTSSRRWTQEGVTRTMMRMLALRAAYRMGLDPGTLARRYATHPRTGATSR